MAPEGPALRALIVDWGGVLTSRLDTTLLAWADGDDLDLDEYWAVMRDWFGDEGGERARWNPVIALERGEMEVPHFEEQLAARLRTRSGRPVQAAGLLERMFAAFEHAPDMANVVRHAHDAGIKTALLSNSWGNSYPRAGWDELFDTVVISGEVGMRKPEPEIFHYTLKLLDVAPNEAVFVDDFPPNVEAAVALGLVGVNHVSYEDTLSDLEALFDRRLQ
jgi:putative hydrolase of the HAD superfamily